MSIPRPQSRMHQQPVFARLMPIHTRGPPISLALSFSLRFLLLVSIVLRCAVDQPLDSQMRNTCHAAPLRGTRTSLTVIIQATSPRRPIESDRPRFIDLCDAWHGQHVVILMPQGSIGQSVKYTGR